MISASTRRALRTGLERAGLLPLVHALRDWAWTWQYRELNRAYLATARNDKLPIPPARLRIRVAASPEIDWFVEGGRLGATSVRGILEKNGLTLASAGSLLDFGCGCGRVLRHFMDDGVALCGSDLNPELIGWNRSNLSPARFEVNGLAPPLPFSGQEFGMVYALSVFTHLPETLQRPWLQELSRVLRPGGHLVFSTHGARYLDQMTTDERNLFQAGRLVVRYEDRAGTNTCGAYHPEDYVRSQLPSALRVVDFIPEGALGNPHQDLWLVRNA